MSSFGCVAACGAECIEFIEFAALYVFCISTCIAYTCPDPPVGGSLTSIRLRPK
jgi:hypothetical protein